MTERLTRRMMHKNVHRSIILRAKERKQLKRPSHSWWADQVHTHLRTGTMLDSTPTETPTHVCCEGILLLLLRMSSKLGVPVYNRPWHPALGYRRAPVTPCGVTDSWNCQCLSFWNLVSVQRHFLFSEMPFQAGRPFFYWIAYFLQVCRGSINILDTIFFFLQVRGGEDVLWMFFTWW